MIGYTVRLSGLLLLVMIMSNAAHGSQSVCSSSNDFSLGEHSPKPSLGIRLFDLNLQPEIPMRIMQHLREKLAQDLKTALLESRYFGTVSILADDSEASPDFTLIGGFTQARIGSNQFNLYNVLTRQALDKPSEISIVAGFLRGGQTEPRSTFNCGLSCCRPVAVAGVPGTLYTGEGKMEQSIKHIADYLRVVYARKRKLEIRE